MATTVLFRKTPKGEEELGTRALNLPVKLRSLLIAVDGKKSSDDLGKAFAALGDVAGMLGELEAKGCLERVHAAPVLKAASPAAQAINKEAKQYMASYLYGALGPESDGMVVRIEKCKSNADLSSILDEIRDVLVAMGKKNKAEEFWSMGKEMLQ
ncbi:MAG: hypothetical protein ACYC7L_03325 [Nitrospirota bacterium]